MDDLPPPPYSVHDENRSDATILAQTSQNMTAFRTIIPPVNVHGVPSFATPPPQAPFNASTPHHASPLPTPLTTSDFRASTDNSFGDLAASGFVSALPYFELRSHNRPRPADTNYHHLIIGPETCTDNLPFPQPSDRWLWRGVDDQDWATFLNHLFPNNGINRDSKSPGGLEADGGLGMQGLSLEKQRPRPDEARPLLVSYSMAGPSSPSPQSFSNTEDDRLRRLRIGAVTSQWNEGFFEPRGLGITLQFANPMYPTSPLSPNTMDFRRRSSSNVLQKSPPPRAEETMLHQAVTKGSKSKVREALEQGDHLEALNKKGETALFRAVYKGEKAIVQMLLDKGANPASRPVGELTPLQYAVTRDKKTILKMLVEKCTLEEIEEVTPAGETALYLAVQKQYNSCIQVLLDHRANLNARPIAKESMLNVAVSAAQTGIVKLLLEKGAYVEERNKDGDTPLGRAVTRGDTKIVKLLLESGASVAARTSKGEAPLSVAVSRGDTSIVTLLLAQKDIDVEVQNLKGETPLYKSITRGDTSITQLLLQKGARSETYPADSESVLNLVVSKGNTTLVHLLLERGVDPEVRNRAGDTPLFVAISRDDVSIASLLISKGADVNTKSAAGEPALYKCVSRGNISLVSILLAHGANSSTLNPSGESPLYKAVYRGDTSIVSLLLSNGANPEILGQNGETCLYRAVYRNDTSIVSLLLGYKANPLSISGSGETALEYAIKKGNKSIIHLLQTRCPSGPPAVPPKC